MAASAGILFVPLNFSKKYLISLLYLVQLLYSENKKASYKNMSSVMLCNMNANKNTISFYCYRFDITQFTKDQEWGSWEMCYHYK